MKPTVWHSTFRDDELRDVNGDLREKPEQCQSAVCASVQPLTDVETPNGLAWRCDACGQLHKQGKPRA